MKKNLKIALIGPSSSGKSTLLNFMSTLNINTIGEVAREVLTQYPNYSRQHQQVKMLSLQYEREELLKRTNAPFISDRGLMDYYVFSEREGLSIPFYRENMNNRYDFVFRLPNKPFRPDGVRVEKDSNEVNEIQDKIEELYIETGHPLIYLPDTDLVGKLSFIRKLISI